MPSYHVVPLNAVVEVSVHGELDLESTRELVLGVADTATAAGKNLLIDLRDVRTSMSYPDVYRVVQLVAQHPDVFSGRLALLDTYDNDFDKTQFFEASSVESGLQARAFIDEDRAKAWLEETA